MRILARPRFGVAIALLAVASQSQAKPPLQQVLDSSREPTSINPVCVLNVNSAQALAHRGDLSSARKLRSYYWDCVSGDYQPGLVKWGEAAAVLGGKVDENEYLRILLEFRFELSNSEWASPATCDPNHSLGRSERDARKSPADTHRQIVYLISCERSGISRAMLRLARQAVVRGGVEDAKFYSDLLRVKRRQSQRR